MFFAEFVLNVLHLVAYILIFCFICGVIPYGALLVREELVAMAKDKKPAQDGRHRKGTGKNDDFITDIVVRFRDGRESILHHRRLVNG